MCSNNSFCSSWKRMKMVFPSYWRRTIFLMIDQTFQRIGWYFFKFLKL